MDGERIKGARGAKEAREAEAAQAGVLPEGSGVHSPSTGPRPSIDRSSTV